MDIIRIFSGERVFEDDEQSEMMRMLLGVSHTPRVPGGPPPELDLDLLLGKGHEFPQLGVKALRELELIYHIALTQNPELYLNCDPDQILNPHAYTVNLHFAEISKIRRQPVYVTVCHRLREINHPKESQ